MELNIAILVDLLYMTMVMVFLDILFGKMLRTGLKIKDHLSLNRVSLFTFLAGLHLILTNRGAGFAVRMSSIMVFIIIYNIFIGPLIDKIIKSDE